MYPPMFSHGQIKFYSPGDSVNNIKEFPSMRMMPSGVIPEVGADDCEAGCRKGVPVGIEPRQPDDRNGLRAFLVKRLPSSYSDFVRRLNRDGKTNYQDAKRAILRRFRRLWGCDPRADIVEDIIGSRDGVAHAEHIDSTLQEPIANSSVTTGRNWIPQGKSQTPADELFSPVEFHSRGRYWFGNLCSN